ncbi:hypothetical protein BOO88_06830 [Stutzerimonas stutzeri]|nr:hypothetical protein BOO88_06830 [Stutzerimonas stutzeri]
MRMNFLIELLHACRFKQRVTRVFVPKMIFNFADIDWQRKPGTNITLNHYHMIFFDNKCFIINIFRLFFKVLHRYKSGSINYAINTFQL